MAAGDQDALAAVSLAEAQAYVRVESGEEEALLAGLLRSATALCETFIGQLLLSRAQTVDVRASGDWTRLGPVPVRAITAVDAIDQRPLEANQFEVDIDARGEGWVRLSGAGESRLVRVMMEAGMASDPNGVPEPIRQGILRLVAHLYSSRDAAGSNGGWRAAGSGDGAVAALPADAAVMREFAGTLNARIVVERAIEMRTATGLQEAGFETVARCLAHVEAEGVGAEAEGMALSAMGRFRLTLRPRDGIRVGMRVRWGTRLLTIRQRVDDPRQPDRMVLRCEEVRA